jgi:pimeloyl-ACP methyl ester carboxylesterase
MTHNLAFLPGTMCDQRVWAPVRALLEPRFSTSYVATETQPTRAGMLELIDSAARASGALHLVAFSMGGYLALDYALAHPGRVASLVTVASSAFGLTEREAAERVRALELLEKHEYRGISPARINQFVHPTRQSDPAVVDVIRAMDRDLGKTVLVNQLRETSTRASLAPRLGELAIPALFIGADADPFVSWESIEQMAALTPGAQSVRADAAGHMIPLEQPDWLAGRIAAFHASV